MAKAPCRDRRLHLLSMLLEVRRDLEDVSWAAGCPGLGRSAGRGGSLSTSRQTGVGGEQTETLGSELRREHLI